MKQKELVVASIAFPSSRPVLTFNVVDDVTAVIVRVLNRVVELSIVHAHFAVLFENRWVDLLKILTLLAVTCALDHLFDGYLV